METDSNRLLNKVSSRKISIPPRLLSGFVVSLLRLMIMNTDHRFVYHFDVRQFRNRQVIVIGDHASREIYKYTLAGSPVSRLNTVIGFHNVFSKGLFQLLLSSGVILKSLYEPDARSVKEMLWVINHGGSLCFFPEGIQSVSGSTQPMNPGTIRFLKKAGKDVILCKSYGAYLCSPRYRRDYARGPQEFHYELLFSQDELKSSSIEELYRKYLQRFSYNDFEWNRRKRNRYVFEGGSAKGIGSLIYVCPKCGHEFTIFGEGNDITCRDCGNRILLNEYYELIPYEGSVCGYVSIDEWFKAQRRMVIEEIQNEDFEVSYEAEYRALHFDRLYDDQEYTIGRGTVTINHSGIRYVGTKHGEQVDLFYDIRRVPSFTFTPDKDNDLYYDGEYILLKPVSDNIRVVKYMLYVEELHNLTDPKWNAVSRDVFDC